MLTSVHHRAWQRRRRDRDVTVSENERNTRACRVITSTLGVFFAFSDGRSFSLS